jgi:hypothetical protein
MNQQLPLEACIIVDRRVVEHFRLSRIEQTDRRAIDQHLEVWHPAEALSMRQLGYVQERQLHQSHIEWIAEPAYEHFQNHRRS